MAEPRQRTVGGYEVCDEGLEPLLKFRQFELYPQIPGAARPEDGVDVGLGEEVLGSSLAAAAATGIKDPHKGLHSRRRIRITPGGTVAPRDIVLRFVATWLGHGRSP